MSTKSEMHFRVSDYHGEFVQTVRPYTRVSEITQDGHVYYCAADLVLDKFSSARAGNFERLIEATTDSRVARKL